MLTNIWFSISMLLLQPIWERDFVLVNKSSPLLPGLLIDDQHLPGVAIFSKQNATLFEKLSDGSTSVGRGVFMHSMVFSWWEWSILARKVSAWEHVS
jgi:hypothetical protein